MTVAYAAREGASLPSLGSTSLVINKPTGTVAGDFLVCFILISANVVITPPAGWTTKVNASGVKCYTRLCDGTEGASFTFTRASAVGNTIIGHMARLTTTVGFPADPVDTIGAQAGGGGTTVVLPTLTPVAGTYLWQMGSVISNSTFTPPGTATEDYDYQPPTQAFAAFGGHETVPLGVATGTRTWTATTSGTRSGVMMTIKEAAAYVENPADTEGLTDDATVSLDMTTTATDPAGLTDEVSGSLDMVEAPADTEGLTDEVTVSIGLGETSIDPLGLTDTVDVTLNLGETITDDEGLTDEVTSVLDVVVLAGDDLTLSDTVVAAMALAGVQADTLTLTDDVLVTLAMAETITDAMGLTDEVSDILGCTPADWPVVDPTRVVAGIVMNHETNTPVEGVLVRLMRDNDDVKVQSTTSGPGGAYAFPRDSLDPYTYHVYAEGMDGTTQVQGVSERGIIPEAI